MDQVHRKISQASDFELGFSSRESLDAGCVLCSGLALGLSQQDSGPALWHKGAASVSPRQGGTPRCPWAGPLVTAVGKACWPLLGLWLCRSSLSSAAPLHPAPRNVSPAHKDLLSREALGSLQVNIVGAVIP